MRKVTGKKKDAVNGEDEGVEVPEQESDIENGEEADPLSEQNGDADAKDGSETVDEDDLPLKETAKKPEKGGKAKKKTAKKAGKKKGKRVTLDVPDSKDDETDDGEDDEEEEEYEVRV